MSSLPLFDYPAKARRSDPQTSRDAAARVNTKKQRDQILAALALRPMTTQEVANHYGVPRENISARFRPMARDGLIEETGNKRDGSIVWKLKGS